jgi:serine/threonine protein kinase
MITEFCESGSLDDLLKEKQKNNFVFNEEEAAIIMKQVLSALSFAHEHNIVHRDMKP